MIEPEQGRPSNDPPHFGRSVLGAVRTILRTRRGSEPPCPWRWCVLIAIAATVLGLLLIPSARTMPSSLGEYGVHAAISVEIAINRVAYARTSDVDERVHQWIAKGNEPGLTFEDTFPVMRGTLNDFLRTDPRAFATQALTLPTLTAGTDERHLSRLRPYAHNESSLVWFAEAVIRANPRATVGSIFTALNVLRIGALMLFSILVLRAGVSPLLAILAFMVSLHLLGEVNATPSLVGVYACFLPMLLGVVGAFGLSLALGAHRRWAANVTVHALLGFTIGFVANIRTSYQPILLAIALLHTCFVAFERPGSLSRGHRMLRCSLAPLALVAGFLVFDRAFVAPLRAVRSELNLHYHTVSHPLVLSLALPANDFARSQGIRWYDFCGIELARRIDPNVRYLAAGYEEAMFAFYRQLWREHPREMVSVYALKLATAGASVLDHAREPREAPRLGDVLVRAGTLPLFPVRHGLLFFGVTLLAGALALVGGRRSVVSRDAVFALVALAVIGALSYLESAAIVSTYAMQYHGFLTYWSTVLGAGISALVTSALGRAIVRARAAPPAAVNDSEAA